MQTNYVAFSVGHERDIAVLASRELIFHNLAAIFNDAGRLGSAILAREIDDDAPMPEGPFSTSRARPSRRRFDVSHRERVYLDRGQRCPKRAGDHRVK